MRREGAVILHRLARVRAMIEGEASTVPLHREIVDILRRLQNEPSLPNARADLAGAVGRLASALEAAGDLGEAATARADAQRLRA
jgi:hypothetical protein